LDDPKTYKGGELEFFDHGIVNPSQPQGCLCLFPSLLTHRVKKVTSGKRSTLVIWGHIFNPEE
jgi:predicted 2-oxoglutarate/Fe(II)-dependent dioxygenase YbiX